MVELLRAYDDHLLLLALQVLDALAMQPLNHRSALDVSRHSTTLHKNTVYFQPLFEIVESSCYPSNSGVMAVGNFLSPTFRTPEELRSIRIDSNSRLKYCKVGSTAAAEEVCSRIALTVTVLQLHHLPTRRRTRWRRRPTTTSRSRTSYWKTGASKTSFARAARPSASRPSIP